VSERCPSTPAPPPTFADDRVTGGLYILRYTGKPPLD
jgi:hypothetical protein